MKEILSSDNKQIKLLKKLSLKKYRQETGLFLVENFVIINDALMGGDDFEAIFISPSFIEKNKDDFEFLKRNSQAEFFQISEEINKSFSNLETASGISAVYKKKESDLSKSSVIYLDNVRDPGNLGTIMRSALAFGFDNLVLSSGCVDVYNHKTIASAKNSIFKLNIHIDKNDEWLKNNINENMKLYVSDVAKGSDVFDFKPAANFCLVLGSESHGVREDILEIADESLMLSINNKMESLNVAVAAGIMFSVLNRNKI